MSLGYSRRPCCVPSTPGDARTVNFHFNSPGCRAAGSLGMAIIGTHTTEDIYILGSGLFPAQRAPRHIYPSKLLCLFQQLEPTVGIPSVASDSRRLFSVPPVRTLGETLEMAKAGKQPAQQSAVPMSPVCRGRSEVVYSTMYVQSCIRASGIEGAVGDFRLLHARTVPRAIFAVHKAPARLNPLSPSQSGHLGLRIPR